MVFVPVRENQGADFVAVLLQISEVGRDNVDAEQFRIRKHHARVDNDNVVPIADGHRIHTEFAQAAKRDQLKLVFRHVRFRLSVGLWVVAGCWWLVPLVAGGWWLVDASGVVLCSRGGAIVFLQNEANLRRTVEGWCKK